MNNEDVGRTIESDDLTLEFFAQGGFNGEEATHCEFLSIVGVHGDLIFLITRNKSTVMRGEIRMTSTGLVR